MMQKLMQKKKLNELLGPNNHNHDQQEELLGEIASPQDVQTGPTAHHPQHQNTSSYQ